MSCEAQCTRTVLNRFINMYIGRKRVSNMTRFLVKLQAES